MSPGYERTHEVEFSQPSSLPRSYSGSCKRCRLRTDTRVRPRNRGPESIKKRKGWKREQERGKNDEWQRQHPHGGQRRAARGRFTYRWSPISPSASWLAPGWARCFRWRRNKPKLPLQSLCARSPWLGQGAANGASVLPPPTPQRRAPSSVPRFLPHRPRSITIDPLPQQREAPEPTSAPHASRRRQAGEGKKKN